MPSRFGTEYLCRRWTRLCSVCRRHSPVLFHRLPSNLYKNSTVGDRSGTGTAYPSGAPEFVPPLELGSCCSFCLITSLRIFSSVVWRQLRISRKNDVWFIFVLLGLMFIFYICFYLRILVYCDRLVGGRLWVLKSINNWNIVDSGVVYHTPLCWCLARYQNQMMFGSYIPRLSLLFRSTLFRPWCFIWIRCSVLSLVVFLFFFVFFFFYFWPLFFFWYLIYGFWKLTSLVSSTFYN